MSRWSWMPTAEAFDRRRQHHDAAFGQGPRVRHGLPARLGGGPVPLAAHPRRERPRRPRGGAPPRLCRHHPGAEARLYPLRLEPAHARALADLDPVALPRRIARGACRRHRGDLDLWRLRHERLWREPLRYPRSVREHLFDPRLAAGAEEPRRQQRRFDDGRLWQLLRPEIEPALYRGGAGGEEHDRRIVGLCRRRAGLPPEIRLREDRRASTATSSPSTSTRPARNACSTSSSSGIEGRQRLRWRSCRLVSMQ